MKCSNRSFLVDVTQLRSEPPNISIENSREKSKKWLGVVCLEIRGRDGACSESSRRVPMMMAVHVCLTHHDQDNYCEVRVVHLGGIWVSPVWLVVFSHLLAMPSHSSAPVLKRAPAGLIVHPYLKPLDSLATKR